MYRAASMLILSLLLGNTSAEENPTTLNWTSYSPEATVEMSVVDSDGNVQMFAARLFGSPFPYGSAMELAVDRNGNNYLGWEESVGRLAAWRPRARIVYDYQGNAYMQTDAQKATGDYGSQLSQPTRMRATMYVKNEYGETIPYIDSGYGKPAPMRTTPMTKRNWQPPPGGWQPPQTKKQEWKPDWETIGTYSVMIFLIALCTSAIVLLNRSDETTDNFNLSINVDESEQDTDLGAELPTGIDIEISKEITNAREKRIW